MKFNILVTAGLYDSQAAYCALQFCNAALDAGHEISQVFFYQAGVTIANQLSAPWQDEFNATDSWADFSIRTGVPLLVCVSAGERRGVINADQQAELDKPGHNMHPNFSVAGLGALHDGSIESDRTVTFK